jgi:hypothetical protein
VVALTVVFTISCGGTDCCSYDQLCPVTPSGPHNLHAKLKIFAVNIFRIIPDNNYTSQYVHLSATHLPSIHSCIDPAVLFLSGLLSEMKQNAI